MRFAFYGRMSTKEFQHRETSRRWQLEVAEETIVGRGVIVAEYFDEGCSRRSPWTKRPSAAALLAAVQSADCDFDAVIVGEYERAFCGNQFRNVMAALAGQGVQLWLPEAAGPVDLGDPAHQALMLLLGSQSRREVLRARHRVMAAMRTQACAQGRFLGGRPPYGYRLVDAGPHPNQAHARWGRRVHQLEPDPVTAPWVRWIFQQRAAGRSIAGLARELNDRGVPCPSGADPARNPHRSGRAWITPTVAGILDNPPLHRSAGVEPAQHGPQSPRRPPCGRRGRPHER
ncbi:recombinase family protein [Saccharopolyspora sp. NPDC050389]|uniref:recombinase family protein n=1 Tax=Saccharopolyspora sp. NPDC050389 TaxID=3155516 RepID=UPI0033E6A66D